MLIIASTLAAATGQQPGQKTGPTFITARKLKTGLRIDLRRRRIARLGLRTTSRTTCLRTAQETSINETPAVAGSSATITGSGRGLRISTGHRARRSNRPPDRRNNLPIGLLSDQQTNRRATGLTTKGTNSRPSGRSSNGTLVRASMGHSAPRISSGTSRPGQPGSGGARASAARHLLWI